MTFYHTVYWKSVLINLCPQLFASAFAPNFWGMLHHICDVPMTKTCVDRSELINVGAQID